MSLKKKLAGAAPFAHLLGLAARGARVESIDDDEEDPKKQREDESDEDYAKRMEEEEKDPNAEDEDPDKGDKPDADDPDKDPEAEDEEDSEAEGEEDDAGDGESKEKKDARRAERKRCAAILAYGVSHGCVKQSCVAAFDTRLSSREAVAMLSAGAQDHVAASGSRFLSRRMAGVRSPNPGAGGSGAPSGSKAAAQMILAAGKKRRGESA